MKKKLLVISAVAVCLAIAAAGTAAYFTAEEKAHNVITTGGVAIEVAEWTMQEGELRVPFPEEGIGGVMPGTSVSKIVTVENTGESEAWVRVKVEIAIVDAEGGALPSAFGGSSTPVVAFTVLTGWQEHEGYYYYDTPVVAGGFTSALFEEVTFDGLIGNEYQSCTATITVTAQAVQSRNNGATVLAAAGWPIS